MDKLRDDTQWAAAAISAVVLNTQNEAREEMDQMIDNHRNTQEGVVGAQRAIMKQHHQIETLRREVETLKQQNKMLRRMIMDGN